VTVKHIVSLSGGIGSYETLKRVIAKEGKENVVSVFCDTLAEDGDLYRFLNDIESRLGIKIVRLCYGKTPLELCFEENFIFNSRIANCSKILKSKPFNNWLKQNYPNPEDCIIYLGIDWTEMHRIGPIKENYKPYRVEFPMTEKPYLTKPEMIEELKGEGIEVPRLYKLGFEHNNCKGCCVKAGIAHYENLLRKDRITYLELENKEERLRERIGKDVSILKRQGKPFTLRQLRADVESQPLQCSLFGEDEWGGCGCFAELDNEDQKKGTLKNE
jgi:3'-phosphoadenosine 5'-phosphosulfate sulfotransferase (PAPS reductase)/FAD synthetase